MPSTLSGQKRASESLDLELQVVVSRHASSRDECWGLWKSSHYSEPLGHLPSPNNFQPYSFSFDSFEGYSPKKRGCKTIAKFQSPPCTPVLSNRKQVVASLLLYRAQVQRVTHSECTQTPATASRANPPTINTKPVLTAQVFETTGSCNAEKTRDPHYINYF